ncbi:hypothetical protein T01_6131 [Trichinella spiralis]|uniref:Uncharacterized protein n=1 Tax=Trichinella spiralis TaxID=6334 RepID=A0A0V0YYW7_TRISP|nr:hypothetical protein T01_6131 [Trichinella spiralis]
MCLTCPVSIGKLERSSLGEMVTSPGIKYTCVVQSSL